MRTLLTLLIMLLPCPDYYLLVAAPAPLPLTHEEAVLKELHRVRWVELNKAKLVASFGKDGLFIVQGVEKESWWYGKGYVGVYRKVPCESDYWVKFRLQRRMFYPDWPGLLAEDVMFLRFEKGQLFGAGLSNADLKMGR